MATPFKSIQCSIMYNNARLLSWTYDPSFTYPGSFTLVIENARNGGDWETLTTISVDTSSSSTPCSYTDSRKRNFNKHMDESYRLRLQIKSGTTVSEEYISKPVDAGILISYPFSSEAKNAISNIQLTMKQSGCDGVLLKRKNWGERCPDCTDFNGQMSVNEHCPTCFGTGITGGYYTGINLSVIKDQVQQSAGQDQLGYGQAQTMQARCIAYPFITDGDVWVETGTNIRYAISGVQATSIYKTVPLVYTMTLRRIEYSDAIYSSGVDDKVAPASVRDILDASFIDYSTTTTTPSVTATSWDAGLSAL